MSTLAAEAIAVPDHIPQNLVRDLDYFLPPGGQEDLHLAWKRVQDTEPEIFWTPRNGGHWIMTRADDIHEMQTNHQRYSQRIFTLPPDPDGQEFLPPNADPPRHGPYRAVIMAAFVPRAIDKLDAAARELTAEIIDGLAPRGECEFMEDFARVLPIAVFLKMVDLPAEDAPRLKRLADVGSRGHDRTAVRDAHMEMVDYLRGWVARRRLNPGDDVISSVVRGKIEGRPITEREILSLLVTVMFGGLDTASSMFGFVARFLATHPEHRRELVAHPERRRGAVEELIRRHGIVNTSRVVTEDFEYKGVRFKAGDLVLVVNQLAGLDERANPEPLTVDFRREAPHHAVFGAGPHTCPGAVLARRELGAFLELWLARIPEFSLRPGSATPMESGPVQTVRSLELVWDPATVRPAA